MNKIALQFFKRRAINLALNDQIKYNYQKNKISLFKAHQNRQIQDREYEDQQIKLNNDVSKIDPYSNSLSQKEIQNFDIYYGRFETVVCQGQGLNRKLVKSLKKYDVDQILRQKLREDYDTIINFIKERNKKMKANEYIYIFQYFYKYKEKFMQFLQDHIDLFDIIIKGLTNVNIYSAIEFVKLQKLVYLFDIKDEAVWKNFLMKGNLLFSNSAELEHVYDSLLQVFKIFLSYEFKDLNSQSILIQIKKKLLRGLNQMDLLDCIELISIIAEKSIFIDPVQIRQFEERFILNKEVLYLEQFAIIFDSMGKLQYQPLEFAEYFLKFKMPKINEIIPTITQKTSKIQAITVQNPENQSQNSQFHQFNSIQISNQDKQDLINFDVFTLFVRGFSQISLFSDNKSVWEQMENCFQNFIEKNGKKGELDSIITRDQMGIIIGSFDKTQLGSEKIWQLLSNRNEFELSYDQNYIILKNLVRFNVFNLKQLNLALSYILDDKTDLPKFENILTKESAQKILEKIQVYALVIYKYIEEVEIGGPNHLNELEFQKHCMKLLLKESINSLIKSQDKKWKNLSENEQIKLYGLLHLCEYKSQFQITQEIAPLEIKIQKNRKTFSVSQVCFLTLMQECFATEEQFSKWNTFIFKCIENASQLEFSSYFATFYLYGLTDPYLWGLLQIKYIENIELYYVEDLLSFMLVFCQKQDIDEEIWQLFIEVLRIKSIKQHLDYLKTFADQIKNSEQKQSILDLISDIESSSNKELDEYVEELNYLQQLNLPFKKIVAKEDPLSVYKASSIKHVINLIN
ncbi:hypothetical protein ABPG72_020263 [Tetrahymena utriculariae]